MFGRQWPWEFFPSRAVLDYPPSDLGVDLSKKLLSRSPFGIAWLPLLWSIRSVILTVCSGWTSSDVVVLVIYRMVSKILLCVAVALFVVLCCVSYEFVDVYWAPLLVFSMLSCVNFVCLYL